MIRRHRRTLPATLVALAGAAGAVIVAVSSVQTILGQPPWLSFTDLARLGADTTWNHPLLLAACGATALTGIVLLAVAVIPGTPTVLPLADVDGQPDTGATTASLRQALAAAAGDVDGVETVAVRLRRSHVTATVHTPIQDRAQISDEVRAAINHRLDDIDLAHRPRTRVRVATRHHRAEDLR